MSSGIDLSVLGKKCADLLTKKEIRFAAIIDEAGSIMAGGFKDGLVPLEGDETRLRAFLQFVSKASIRKEYDDNLGPINYIAARRDKIVLISFPFPISRMLLLISAEPTANIEELALQVVGVFKEMS